MVMGMNEQMRLNLDDGTVEGQHEQKERLAIERLKAFEPPEGYYHTMSYGKDSQCTYHLLKLAGCKFDSHYAVTSCDPPELIRFGRKCRCDKALVLNIENLDGSGSGLAEIASGYDNKFIYRVGETVKVSNFDDDRTHECAPGIHFFITRQEAVDYYG